ncbi:MAG: 50S ribosomal protein L15e [Candidatus Micrarchaeia archaeon]
MGAYKYIQKTLQKEYKERGEEYRKKIVQWRKEPVMNRIERPTNLARARTLGYQAKNGYVLVRTRIGKGRRRRRTPMGGRKPRHNYLFKQPGLSHQTIAEQRVNKVYPNMEVLNSYWVGEDGEYKFFEILLVDQARVPLNLGKRRAFRGLTSSGRKARSLVL